MTPTSLTRWMGACVLLGLLTLLTACNQSLIPGSTQKATSSLRPDAHSVATPTSCGPEFADPLPGMPPVIDCDIYAATKPGMLSPAVAHDPALVYVPDSYGTHVTVISQKTLKIVRTFETGFLSQHVVPSYDLKTLWVNASAANQFVPIDPQTGKPGRPVAETRPYNLYFTPNGRQAVVMVEENDIIRFADPHTFAKIDDVHVGACRGPNHADFSANGRFFVVSCEFSGVLVKVDTVTHRVLGVRRLPTQAIVRGAAPGMGMSMPQDVRLSPDGKTFYIADMGTNQVVRVDAMTFKIEGAIAMPKNPHGIYFSRDSSRMYVSDRGAGKVSVIDWRTNRIVATWVIPGGGSPDMGGVSADGTRLWLSGRYDGVVYVFNTVTGKLIAKIPVPETSPHGLAVWPQPGRYSLGHTGNMR
ncbi:MAG: beta-propeller fold lactonase family protein [Marmoricola sp.]